MHTSGFVIAGLEVCVPVRPAVLIVQKAALLHRIVVLRGNFSVLGSSPFELLWNVCLYLGVLLVLPLVEIEAHGSRVY